MISDIRHVLNADFSTILTIGHDMTCAVMILYLAKLALGRKKNGNNSKGES